MKIRLYLQDWFYNAGIVGFLKLFENQDVLTISKEKNFVEFDSEILRNFHQYYFAYWKKKYNVAERMKERIEKSFFKIEFLLEQESKENQTKEELKKNLLDLKEEKKRIKESLKKQLDKIKKYDEELYQKMQEQYVKIDSFKTKEDISEMQTCKEVLETCFQQEEINNKLTSNIFKSILSNQFFGQPSFLNVTKSSMPYEEQQNLLYRDYVSNVVETGFLKDILDGNKYTTLQVINEYIDTALEKAILTSEMTKIYRNIKEKYIAKQKTLEEIKQYLKEKVLKYCCLCGSDKKLVSDFSEGHFIPLALSSENAQNFFWNQEVKFPICDMCKLVLFCIPLGVTPISKIVKTIKNGQLTVEEKEINSFVNFDTSVKELYQINQNFSDRSSLNPEKENPYLDMIMGIVEQNQQLSEWKLKNIFVVEFEAEYQGFSRIYYFHIPSYVATFFVNYANQSLKYIKDYRYRLQLIDFALKNKDLKYAIQDKLHYYISNHIDAGSEVFWSVKMRFYIQQLKKGEGIMQRDKIEDNQKKLHVLYNLGTNIHGELKVKNEENKLNGYTYRMLNSLKARNQEEFMDLVIRLHMLLGKDVSQIFIQAMQDEDLDFVSVGQSFLAGLISNRYESDKTKKEDVINE